MKQKSDFLTLDSLETLLESTNNIDKNSEVPVIENLEENFENILENLDKISGKYLEEAIEEIPVKQVEEVPINENIEKKSEDYKLTDKEENTVMENAFEKNVKASSPVDGTKEVVVTPTGKVTNPGVIDFQKQTPISHEDFVKNALGAKKQSDELKEEHKAPKFNPKSVEVKLLKHADQYKDFIKSFRDDSNGEILEAVLEAFEATVETAKAKLAIEESYN